MNRNFSPFDWRENPLGDFRELSSLLARLNIYG
jgi:hypothetical protein